MRVVANEADAHAQETRAAVGHNRPPEGDPLTERLREEHALLLDMADTLVRQLGALPPKITDEEQRHRASDFAVNKLADTAAKLEKLHAHEKEPYLAGGRTCDSVLLTPAKLLRDGKRKVELLIGAYLDEVAERERLAREEEARKAAIEAERLLREAEAAAAEAATEEALEQAVVAEDKAAEAHFVADKAQQAAEARPADLTRGHSATGVLSSLKKELRCDGFDRAQLDLEPLRPYLPQAALETAIKAFLRAGGRSLRGAVIREVAKATVR
jgi:hypothetical protein